MQKKMHHKIPRGNLIMTLCFFAVTFSTILIFCNIHMYDQIEFVSRGCYTDVARNVTIEAVSEETDLSPIAESVQTTALLYRTNLNPEGADLRGVFIKGNPSFTPPILEGRFFKESDNFAETPTAVVGRSYLPDMFDKDGSQYIRIGDTDFQVIGILGIQSSSRLDALRIINMGAAQKIYGVTGEYKLDTETKQENSQARRELESGLGSTVKLTVSEEEKHYKIGTVTDPITGESKTVQTDIDAYERSGLGTYIYLIILATFLLCTVSTTVFWARNRASEVAVEWMVGLTKREILQRRLKNYLSLCFIGCVLGILLSGLLAAFRVLTLFSIWDLVIACAVSAVIGAIILTCVCMYQYRSNPVQELR